MAAFSYIIKKCIPPHPSRYSLDTFSRLGEGFYRYAFFGRQCALSRLRRRYDGRK